MKFSAKSISFILFLVFSFLFFVSKAFASSEFTNSYNIQYLINSDGKTHVTQNIILENKTTEYYATKFNLTLGVLKAENVKSKDSLGPLETVSEFENNTTTIEVSFTQKIVGLGKSYNFTIEYDAPEVATKVGQIWEINIPKLATLENVTAYDLSLIIPQNFGKLSFISPQPIKTEHNITQRFFHFNKDQLQQSGVSASFGEKQIFDFRLLYYLKNPNFTSGIVEIALPPDTNYQKIIYSQIIPKPQNISVDKDGNWLATYKLKTKQKLTVKVIGQVEIYPNPVSNVDQKLSDSEKAIYLQSQPFWEVDNPNLAKKAKELKTSQQIYQFVTDYLSYNQDRLNQETVKRLGAKSAFAQPKDSVCMEFTDLFIALSRAAGIPAREINGFAYSQNERLRPLSLAATGTDVLHAWPEYWDSSLQTWIQVDPTWDNTSGGIDYFSKLDFNHFTFVRKGISSQSPLPAGAYKQEGGNSKDVEVTLAQKLIPQKQKITLSSGLPNRIFSFFLAKGKISVSNEGNFANYGTLLKVGSDNIDILSEKTIVLPVLPPFSTYDAQVLFLNKDIFKSQVGEISLTLGDQHLAKKIIIQPAIYLYVGIGGILVLIFSTAAYLIYRHLQTHDS